MKLDEPPTSYIQFIGSYTYYVITIQTFRSEALPRGNLQCFPIQMEFILRSKSLLIRVILPLESQIIDWLNDWLNGFSALGIRSFYRRYRQVKIRKSKRIVLFKEQIRLFKGLSV